MESFTRQSSAGDFCDFLRLERGLLTSQKQDEISISFMDLRTGVLHKINSVEELSKILKKKSSK